ncbi:MAG: hypothetical protein V2A76_13785, partial [Planctomycetota bacterium]
GSLRALPDGVAAGLAAFSLLALLKAVPGGRRARWLWLAGACAALSALLDPVHLILLLPGLLFFCTRHQFAPARAGLSAARILLPAVLGVAGLLLLRNALYGSPFLTGERFWAPAGSAGAALANAPSNLRQVGRLLLNLEGGLLSWPVTLLVLLGVAHAVRGRNDDPRARCLLLAGGILLPVYLASQVVQRAMEPLALLPVLSLLGLFAALGVRCLKFRWISAAAALLALAILGSESVPALFEDRRPEPRAMMRALATLDRDIDPHALVIVNFPLALAETALGPDRQVLLNDLEAADPDMAVPIRRHRLKGPDGEEPKLPALVEEGFIRDDVVRLVKLYVAERRPVCYLYAAGESAGGDGILRLRNLVEIEESVARPPLTLFRLRPR